MGDVLELFGAFLDFPDRPGPQKRSSSGLQRSSSGDVSSELEGFFVGLPVGFRVLIGRKPPLVGDGCPVTVGFHV